MARQSDARALTATQALNNTLDLDFVIDDAIREGNKAKAAAAEALRVNASCSLAAVQAAGRRA